MSIELYMVESDTAPSRTFTIERPDANNVDQPVDLTGASVKLVLRDTSTNSVTNSGHQALTVDPDQINNKGQVTYAFAAGDIASGNVHLGDLQITFPGSQVETEYDYVTIHARPKVTTIS